MNFAIAGISAVALVGFNGDPAVHIPLPESLKQAQATMRRFAMAGLLDKLELKLNRAAERAAPKARRLFLDAVAQMTLTRIPQITCRFEDVFGRFCYKNQCNTFIATGKTRVTRRVIPKASHCRSISTAA